MTLHTARRSQEWLTLIDAANNWQQSYDLLLFVEGDGLINPERVAIVAAAEQAAYDAWTHALVAFERAENRRGLPVHAEWLGH